MKTVFIPLNTSIPIERQFPKRSKIWGNYEFIIAKSCTKHYDYIVVLDDLHKEINIKCKKSNIILLTGEPPYVKLYPNKYLNQFGQIITCQDVLKNRKNCKIHHPILPWMLYYNFYNTEQGQHQLWDYDYFLNNNSPNEKVNKICLFTSNKRISKGHIKRIDFALKLKNKYPNLIDIYGKGFEDVDYKYEILQKYKYSIVIENCQYPNYWTEKLADCFLANSYPIYCGDPNILSYFNEKSLSIINIENFEESEQVIRKVLDNNIFEKQFDYIIQSKLLILNTYNMFSEIAHILDNIKENGEITNTTLKPIQFNGYERVRKYLFKLFNIYINK